MKNLFIASLLFLSLLTGCQKKPDCMAGLAALEQEQKQQVDRQAFLLLDNTITLTEYNESVNEINATYATRRHKLLENCD